MLAFVVGEEIEASTTGAGGGDTEAKAESEDGQSLGDGGHCGCG